MKVLTENIELDLQCQCSMCLPSCVSRGSNRRRTCKHFKRGALPRNHELIMLSSGNVIRLEFSNPTKQLKEALLAAVLSGFH